MTNQKITAETIIRTVLLVFTLVNTILTSTGKNPLPFSDDFVYELVSNLCLIGAAAWAWWKNNSFTKEAIQADEYMHALKDASAEQAEKDKATER